MPPLRLVVVLLDKRLPLFAGRHLEKQTIISFVRWVLTDGQNTAVADGYVPVPAKIIRHELQLLDAMNR